ncbi:uncharacterized protein FIESC28_01902 [Fusarium coffeatum]|uniref:Uncharacterized protein n=1 Tax=Fusarium coffeatum TaxID=231269 RepID=A0A366S7I1_9HYPO|nr:uncharacterized protein FIESC28_01902 [Fusarium coffeatum]RBR25293.1 hypothetical protein FIESC28_01902 [Fusarium coffeatum]
MPTVWSNIGGISVVKFHNIRALDGDGATAGMVHLLRYQLPPSTSVAELLDSSLVDNYRDAEVTNPILRLAWQNITWTESAVQDCVKVKALVLEAFEPQGARDSKLTFEGLAFSQLMEDTFWSRDEFSVIHEVLMKPKGANGWLSAGTSPQQRVNMGTPVIRMRRFPPGISFENTVGKVFEINLLANGDRIARLCGRPYSLRFKYVRDKDRICSFKEIKNIWVPIAQFEGHELKATEKKALYTLVAAVFLDTNQIHMYNPMGSQILPDVENPVTHGKRWSVEDKKDGSFLLFYVCVGDLHSGDLQWDTFNENSVRRVMDFEINLE